MQQSHTIRFILSILIFFIFINIVLFNTLPNALKIIDQDPEKIPNANSLSVELALPLNEFYLKNELRYAENKFYTMRMAYYSDNHILMPVYRALKTGLPLHVMGYNEGGQNEGAFKKNIDSTNPFNYTSLYPSTWNNMGQILYAVMPKHLQHIKTPAQELEAAKVVTNFRYVLAYIHLFSLICFFMALYKRLGPSYAWSFALVIALSPNIFFSAGNLFKAIMMPLFNMAYVIYFYPKILHNINAKNYSLFALGFAILSGVQNIFGSLYYLQYNWAPAIATIFFIELYYMYKHKKAQTLLMPFLYTAMRVMGVLLLSLCPFVLISYIEIREMIAIFGPETFEKIKQRSDSNFLKTIYPDSGGQSVWKPRTMTTLYDFVVHMAYYYYRMITGSMVTIQLWIAELDVVKYLRIKILHFMLICTGIMALALAVAGKKIYNTMMAFVLFLICFIILSLGINLVSSMSGYHLHITGPFYSTYLGVIFALFCTKSLRLIFNKEDKEFFLS